MSRLNPKVGVQWDITPDLQLRAAYIETVKPALAANRTLEPTQVAGFNQFFDEANATKSSRYGFGVDWQVTPDLAIGGEMTWRDIEEPFIDADQDQIVEVDRTSSCTKCISTGPRSTSWRSAPVSPTTSSKGN